MMNVASRRESRPIPDGNQTIRTAMTRVDVIDSGYVNQSIDRSMNSASGKGTMDFSFDLREGESHEC